MKKNKRGAAKKSILWDLVVPAGQIAAGLVLLSPIEDVVVFGPFGIASTPLTGALGMALLGGGAAALGIELIGDNK